MPALVRGSFEDLMVGWRKVASRLGLTIYVFKIPSTSYGHGEVSWMACTNLQQGVGELVATIGPTGLTVVP
jgi:hypothetical protein